MRILDDHRLREAIQVDCPNCDDRPDGAVARLIVIHGISLPSGHFGGPYIEELFCNRLDTSINAEFASLAAMHVSSHLLVRRDGEIRQFVPFHRRAWHAGQSSYKGVEQCNDYSIGIELEGTDNTPYNSIQYSVLAETCRALIDFYPELSETTITGHSDIAPGRKTDPGTAFDWDLFEELLGEA